MAIFEALRKTEAAPAFREAALRRVLLAAARLHGIGASSTGKPPQKMASRFVLDLAVPPGWSHEEWDLLATVIRYHRGAEPSHKSGRFSKLAAEQQGRVRALAGVLRLARALRKSGVPSGVGIRSEKSAETVVLRIPALVDDLETAARLAAGKHLLEEYLEKPLILKPVVKHEKVVTLPPQPVPETPAMASD